MYVVRGAAEWAVLQWLTVRSIIYKTDWWQLVQAKLSPTNYFIKSSACRPLCLNGSFIPSAQRTWWCSRLPSFSNSENLISAPQTLLKYKFHSAEEKLGVASRNRSTVSRCRRLLFVGSNPPPQPASRCRGSRYILASKAESAFILTWGNIRVIWKPTAPHTDVKGCLVCR